MCFKDGDCNSCISMMFFSYVSFLIFFFLIAEVVYSMVHRGQERHCLLVHLLMNAVKVT